jgi:hypothetical protein
MDLNAVERAVADLDLLDAAYERAVRGLETGPQP